MLSRFRPLAIALGAALTLGEVSSQVTVYTDLAAFQSATASTELTIPPASTFPNPFPGVTDVGCVDHLVGIGLPQSDPLVVITAPLAVSWLCIAGPATNLTNTVPLPVEPTIGGNGEDDYELDFTTPVSAVGLELLTNALADETITITFADQTVLQLFDSSLETQSNTFEFVGWTSTKPIVRVHVDTSGGAAQNEGISGVHVRLVDTDADGLADIYESNTGVFVNATDTGTDPNNPDTDADGLMDGTEVDMQQGSSVPGCPSPLDADSDDDTLVDGVEVTLGTNTCDQDTDGDTLPDATDSNPTDPSITSSVVESTAVGVANYLDGVDVALFEGPNDNARRGRSNSLVVRIRNAAKRIAAAD